MMTKELITHSNLVIAENTEFVLMPNSLNEKELNMLLLLVAQVKPTDKEFNWVSIPYDTFIERYNNSTIIELERVKNERDMYRTMYKRAISMLSKKQQKELAKEQQQIELENIR